jgi:ATP-dependent helicase HrpA
LPRYLKGMLARIERLALGKGEARQALDLKAAPGAPGAIRDFDGPRRPRPGFERYRWMVEEFRVQLFAQSLGVQEKVSHTRLERQWRTVRELQAGVTTSN